MLSVIADGGIILSRVVNDKQALPRQIMLYRDFIRALSWVLIRPNDCDAQSRLRRGSADPYETHRSHSLRVIRLPI